MPLPKRAQIQQLLLLIKYTPHQANLPVDKFIY